MRDPTAFRRLDELLGEDLRRAQMHELLDQGMKLCDCGAFGWRKYCGSCGARFGVGKWRECPNRDCNLVVTSDWCPGCGTQVAPEFLKQMERGEVDWAAEAAMADDIVRRIFAGRPDLLHPRDPVDLITQLNRGFGNG